MKELLEKELPIDENEDPNTHFAHYTQAIRRNIKDL